MKCLRELNHLSVCLLLVQTASGGVSATTVLIQIGLHLRTFYLNCSYFCS
uniref:Uncharacterized protein n=1 Tax=Anguilla anguilla TaxID=7936 RepID=A0A0E9XNN7_ANGAN